MTTRETDMIETTPKWAWAFVVAVAVWAAGMAGGYALVQATSELPRELPPGVATVDDDFGVGHAAAPETDAGLMAFIFRRNLSVYLWLLTGLLSGGSVTFAVLLANGIVLGQAIGLARQAGASAEAITGLLLPHGVLEVGAFCIAGAVGFQGLRLACAWRRTGWPAVRDCRLGLVLAFGVASLAVAAAIETLVTGALAESMGYR